jgi:hypothetical protein
LPQGIPRDLWAAKNPELAKMWGARNVLTRANAQLAENERLHIFLRHSSATTATPRQGKTRDQLKAELVQAKGKVERSGRRHGAKDDVRWQAAIHEAGHAVVGHLLGGCIFTIEADEDGDTGRTGFHNDDELSPEVKAVMCFAGALAESKLTGEPAEMSSSDAEYATQAVRSIARNKQQFSYDDHPMWRKWQAKAERLVDQHWHKIQNVAREIIAADGELENWQLAKIVRGEVLR